MQESSLMGRSKQKPESLNKNTGLSITNSEGTLDAFNEETWIEVIHKMDEVYSELLQHQVALEEKNAILEETQQFLESVMSSMTDVLVVCDRYGKVIEVNRSFCDLIGRDDAAFKNINVVDLFYDVDGNKGTTELKGLWSKEKTSEFEVQVKARDETLVPVAFSCSARYNQQGRQVGMVMMGRPVGELRKAYQALSDAHEAVKRTQQQLVHSEKMASLGRLVAGVAHELNNPISFVLGNVHALGRYGQRLNEYLDRVHSGDEGEGLEQLRESLRIDRILSDLPSLIEGTLEGADRCRHIVDGLKRFSVFDKDESERLNLVDVIERALHWVDKATPNYNFNVETDLPSDIPVVANEGLMQQVITNLVQNAYDAVGEDGEGSLAISSRSESSHIELDFHDQGPGVQDEDLGRVFDPFFTTKPVGKGTGLGLPISYGIVDRYGGELSVRNHANGGAVFTLRLPLVGG